jgi:hypothetical protein
LKVEAVTRVLSVLGALGLLAIGVLHAIWTFSPWPMATWTEFAHTLLGAVDGRVPPELPALSALLAAALFVAAYAVVSRAGLVPEFRPRWFYQASIWIVGSVLLLRGTIGGFLTSGLRLQEAPDSYYRADLLVYSPTCVVLGAIIISVAVSARRRESPVGVDDTGR